MLAALEQRQRNLCCLESEAAFDETETEVAVPERLMPLPALVVHLMARAGSWRWPALRRTGRTLTSWAGGGTPLQERDCPACNARGWCWTATAERSLQLSPTGAQRT